MQSTIRSLGYIKFRTHSVHVSRDLDSGHYVCFKSTDSHCDFDILTSQDSAVDYILAPMKTLVYYVEIVGDSES